jgi:hypothetical protein
MGRIDLFEQIKAFDYMCLTSSLPGITGNIRSVYFALLMTNNSTYWSENFEVDFDIILKTSRVDKDTYRRAMDYLKDLGLLTMYEKGVNKYSRARVSLKVLTEKPTGNTEANATGNTEPNRVSVAHNYKTVNNKQKNIKHKEGSSFAPPTLNEIRSFFYEILNFNPDEGERFFYHYESNGWLVGKNKMKNWQAAARNWIKKAEEFKKEKSSAQKEKNSDRGVRAIIESFSNIEMWE